MSYMQLLDPKGAAKAKDKGNPKKKKHYGPQQSRKPTASKDADPTPPKLDAKALLDPKTAASMKSPAPTPGSPSASMKVESAELTPRKLEARALLDPRAASRISKSPAPATDSASTNMDTDKQLGMGDLIVRQNNLVDRQAQAPRKRKIESVDPNEEDDQEHKATRTTFNGITGGGEIGKYMKEEREKGARNEPIDLTDDTNDVVLVSESTGAEHKEVCLGMLHSQAIAWQIPTTSRYRSAKNSKEAFWPDSRVNFRRSPAQNLIIELFSDTGTGVSMRFGNMDAKLAHVLCPLLDGNTVNKMRVKVYLLPLEKRPGEFPGFRTSRAIKLRVVVFAPRVRASVIGKVLSQHQFFLSRPPEYELRGVAYENPHDPKIFGGAMKTLARNAPQTSKASFVTRTQEEILRETSDMFDSLVKTEDLPGIEADVASIKTPLLSHQKQALYFMTQRERGDDIASSDGKFSLWKTMLEKSETVYYNIITNHKEKEKPKPVQGGILADVMGLGKTLSILALLAETRKEARTFGQQEAPMDEVDIQRQTKATLIICPKSVMANWTEQIATHTVASRFKVYSYHGTSRTDDVEELAKYDIVLAPYQTVAAEFGGNKSKTSVLASVKWFRVVLDEAHQIRNPSTGVSKACCKLPAQRRWAVTGTPVQNRLDDLGALIKFLRIEPFDDPTVWSQHIIAPFRAASEHVITHLRLLVDNITLRRMKDNIGLTDRTAHRVRLDFSEDEALIYSQFAKASNQQLRMMLRGSDRLKGKSYAHVLKSLGRLRAICAHGREMLDEDSQKELEGLTAGTAIDLGDEPTSEPDTSFITEKSAYETLSMMMESEVNICAGCSNKITPNNDKDDDESDSDDSSTDSSEEEDEEDTLGYMTPCFHLLCEECKENYIEESRPKLTDDHYHTCVYCDQYTRWGLFELTRTGLKNLQDARAGKKKGKAAAKWDESTYSGPHTKVKALLEDLKESQRETATLPPGEPPIRSVVFSGWTTYLDLIEHALDLQGIGHVRLDGTMSIKKRTAVLETFKTDPTITVLLASIKAAGQGLNFTAASKAFMMEPQFNPGVEAQAIDRVHRLGQKRDVVIKHFIMRGSVEEKILELQEKKQKLAQLSMEKKVSRAEEAKKRIEELRSLFK
ncbi:SNF2 family N-terminal domain-containing protein [Neohortaea acidophila]|uniref:SNF2 family N-terminal domain-containing protein n=1 Tax=Neohortaea acidophila TaxID=245834 RepID=A0A6A6PI80_9PEZI|nr:SNF2 family N-terminal domain-containing protein [Neohortaea acidophila]KAF2479719.1 SNF2 family N-terminal domain-containing protein [Neohortaea acidophila]